MKGINERGNVIIMLTAFSGMLTTARPYEICASGEASLLNDASPTGLRPVTKKTSLKSLTPGGNSNLGNGEARSSPGGNGATFGGFGKGSGSRGRLGEVTDGSPFSADGGCRSAEEDPLGAINTINAKIAKIAKIATIAYTSGLVLISELLHAQQQEKNRKMKIGLLARATWDHASAGTKCCSPATNVTAVDGLPWSGGCGAVPAGDSNQKSVGIVTNRDLCVALGTRDRRLRELCAGQAVSRRVAICRLRVRR